MHDPKPAPKRSHKKSAPIPATAPTSSAVPQWMVDALAEQEADHAAAVAAAAPTLSEDDQLAARVAAVVVRKVAELRADNPAAADQLAKALEDKRRPAPRPNARQLLAEVSFEERRLAWSVAALEEDKALVLARLLNQIKQQAHNGGVGNQRHALHSLEHSGCIGELSVVDLLLRTLTALPEVVAAVALITPLEEEVAQLDAAAEERRAAIAAAEAAHELIVRAAREAADKAIESSPEVAASNLRIFELMHPADL